MNPSLHASRMDSHAAQNSNEKLDVVQRFRFPSFGFPGFLLTSAYVCERPEDDAHRGMANRIEIMKEGCRRGSRHED